jgi:signal transduction histidine kinase
MGVIAAATAAIAAAPELDAALRALLDGVQALTGATAGAVRLPSTPGTVGPGRAYRWFGGERYEWQDVETLSGSVTAEVLANGLGRYVPDNAAIAATGDPGATLALRSFGVRSSLIVPLRAAGATEGTVHANSDRPNAFRAEQIGILQVLADHAGAAVERVRMLAETRAEVGRRAVAEEALRASEDRFRRQYKGNPIPVYTWRRDGDDYVLADYNDAAQAITGGAIHSILGVRCGAFYADAPEVLGDFRRCVAEGSSVRREMWYRLRSNDELRYLVVTYVPLPPDLIAVYTEDATARKLAEEQAASQERSEKLQLLGQMAGGVAHDLSQSLAMVAGFADLAKHALAAPAPDVTGVRAMLDTVTRAAMDGGAAVQRLLVFTRDRDDGPPERVDVSALLREVAELTAPRWQGAAQAEGRPIALAVDAESAATVMGHPAILRQALTNLVVNAVDALPEGGSVRLTSELRGDTVAIAVADTGVGMTEEVRRRALEPFYSTKGDRGTGLGLAQVVAIAEKHGGRVELRSSPGQGTTVTLELPAAATSPPDRAARVPAAAPATGASLRVLVVDDEPTLADMAATMLERGGHSTATACSGEAALALLEAERYDLVVSDLSLGAGMNGWEVAARIRERWPNTRVALATGWGASIDRAQARARGVETVLAKPYRVADLQALAAR